MGNRDDAIRNGIIVSGTRYEVGGTSTMLHHYCLLPSSDSWSGLLLPKVHRHHPPLVYGRTMGGHMPEHSEGCAVCKVEAGITGCPCYGLITYK